MPSRVFRNTTIVFAGEAASKVLDFVFVLAAANYLGASGFGVLSAALAYTALFSFLTDMGLFQLTVRELARGRIDDKKYVSEVAGLKLSLNIAIYTIMCASAYAVGYPLQTVEVILLVGVSMTLESFNYLYNSIFQAYERLRYYAVGRVLGSVALICGGLLSMEADAGLFGFALAYVIARGLNLAYGITTTNARFYTVGLRFDAGKWTILLRESWPFGMTTFVTNIFLSADVVLIAYLLGSFQAGVYSAASRLIVALGFILIAYNQAVYPALSRLHKNRVDFNKVSGFYLKSMLFIGIPMVALTMTNADAIIGILYSKDYQPAALILATLVWSMFLGFLSSPYHRILDATGRQRTVFYAITAGTIVNVTLNLALIPAYGITAAAYAAVIGQLIFLIIPAAAAHREGLNPQVGLRNIISAAVATIIMVLSINMMPDNTVLRILVPSTLYVTAYALTGGLKEITQP